LDESQFNNDFSWPIAKCWNEGIKESNDQDCSYTLLLNDDILFKDKGFLQKTLDMHDWTGGCQNGIVHLTEAWSATSIDNSLLEELGPFDDYLYRSK